LKNLHRLFMHRAVLAPLSEALEGRDLAVVSGMTPDNVAAFMPYFTLAGGHQCLAQHAPLRRETLLAQFVRGVHAHRPE
jgi:hypothetical protein